jgi:hypothetical protein
MSSTTSPAKSSRSSLHRGRKAAVTHHDPPSLRAGRAVMVIQDTALPQPAAPRLALPPGAFVETRRRSDPRTLTCSSGAFDAPFLMGTVLAPASAHQAFAGAAFPPGLAPCRGEAPKGFRRSLLQGGVVMNSADRMRWPRPSAALPVHGGIPPDPDPRDSAPDGDDALTEVLRAMRDEVEQRRDARSGRARD